MIMGLSELFFWSFVGGLVGALFLDIASSGVQKLSGGSAALIDRWGMVGRWCLGMFDGRFVYKDISQASPLKNENSAGWFFHYLIGGGVGFMYPIFYLAFNVPMPENHLISGLLFGLVTVILPWCIMFPAFGMGFFGIRASNNTGRLIKTTIIHISYGLGFGIVLNIASL